MQNLQPAIRCVKRIGLFDSGLGGLTVLRALRRAFPLLQYIYLGDTARAPYGSKSPSTIQRYARECVAFLERFKVDVIISACNTASAVALPSIAPSSCTRIIGTIAPATSAALRSSATRHVAVLGTEATIASGAFQRELRSGDTNIKVSPIACPLFVPLVEQGLLEGEIVSKVIDLYLAPTRETDIDTVILGCTHYPLLKRALSAYLGERIQLVDCADGVVEELRSSISAQCDEPLEQFYVTDEVNRFNFLAATFLESREIQALSVESLVV